MQTLVSSCALAKLSTAMAKNTLSSVSVKNAVQEKYGYPGFTNFFMRKNPTKIDKTFNNRM